jgi:hypothetical protein
VTLLKSQCLILLLRWIRSGEIKARNQAVRNYAMMHPTRGGLHDAVDSDAVLTRFEIPSWESQWLLRRSATSGLRVGHAAEATGETVTRWRTVRDIFQPPRSCFRSMDSGSMIRKGLGPQRHDQNVQPQNSRIF